MEFEGQYLTYEDYKALGGTLDLTPFNILEFEIRRQIDVRTFNRLKEVQVIPQEVKLCEYSLINKVESYTNSRNTAASTNAASESIDGYSISYLTPDRIEQIIKSKNAELDDVIRSYLSGVVVNNEHLIYCGVE